MPCSWRTQESFERSSELNIEDCVDDWVEETVDVAEPYEEREQDRIYLTYVSWQIVSYASSFDHVECEEWNPAEEEDTWSQQN